MPVLLLILGVARAATWTVGSSGADFSTVSEAIVAASDGDLVLVAAGTYTECLDPGGKDLDIIGEDPATTTLQGDGSCESLLVLDDGEALGLSAFTLLNTAGRAVEARHAALTLQDVIITSAGLSDLDGGAIYLEASELQLTDSALALYSGRYGGAIYATDGSTVQLDGATLEDGSATIAAIYLADASASVAASALTMTDSTLSGHQGGTVYVGVDGSVDSTANSFLDNLDHAPAINNVYLASGATLQSADDLFSGNGNDVAWLVAGASGGAITAASDTSITLSGGSFLDNEASNAGAIYQAGSGSTLTIQDTTFSSNRSWQYGGAVELIATTTTASPSLVTITGAMFSDNRAGQSFADEDTSVGRGGALSLLARGAGSALTIEDSSFEDNDAHVTGGALFLYYWDSVKLSGLSFDGNQASGADDMGSGGAIYAKDIDAMVLEESQFTNDYADYYGGGLTLWSSGTLSITDASFCGELSWDHGGALSLDSVDTVDVSGTTFCANYAEEGAAVWGATGGTWTWTNNLFIDNGDVDAGSVISTAEGGAIHADSLDDLRLINNSFLGNLAEIGGAIHIEESALTMVNDLLAWNTGTAVYGAGTIGSATFAYSDWYENDADVGGLFSLSLGADGNSGAAPRLRDYSMDFDCSNDDLRLADGSALIDAGDPALSDPDGTVSDIGAYGGPGAEAEEAEDPGDTGDTGDTGGGGGCGPATGGVLTVGPDGDCPDIASAIAAAVDGDTIRVAAGSYAGCLDAGGKDLILQGEAGSGATSITGSCDPLIALNAGENASISGFTLSDGGGSCLRLRGGTVDLDDLVFAGCGDADRSEGGGISMASGSLSLSDSAFLDGAAYAGAAIYAEGSAELDLDGVSFQRNIASYAGTLYLDGGADGAPVTLRLSDCSFTEDVGGDLYAGDWFEIESQANTFQDTAAGRAITVERFGALRSTDDAFLSTEGGIATGTGVTLSVLGGLFSDTDAPERGGGIWAGTAGTLSIEDTRFEDIEAEGSGGALYVSAGTSWTVSGSTFSGNSLAGTRLSGEDLDGACGGIVALSEGSVESSSFEADLYGEICADTLTLSGSDLIGASALYVDNLIASDVVFRDSLDDEVLVSSEGEVSLTDVVLRDSGTLYLGLPVAVTIRGLVASWDDTDTHSSFVELVRQTGDVSIEDSWFCNGKAAYGGAVQVDVSSGTDTSTVTLRNNVFVENEATFGGAISASYAPSLVIEGNTFVGNASGQGGGLYAYLPKGSWTNNIVAWTTKGYGLYALRSSGTMAPAYSDWYENVTDHTYRFAGFSASASGNTSVDPGFVEYSMDANCANDSLWLDVDSPLIDAGDPSLLDADGSVSDMGAWSGTVAPALDWDGDRYFGPEDCDDWDPDINPGARELCDGVDEDCDGLIDDADDDLAGGTHYYTDADGDGYGDPATELFACEAPAGVVTEGGDCDDGDPELHPGATELCDPADVDEDCDGLADDADAGPEGTTPFHVDADCDGHGDPDALIAACDAHDGVVSDDGDCDDTDADVHPSAVEVCDDADVDEDCDGLVDDADPSVTETATWYTDLDGDGYAGAEATISACDLPEGAFASAEDCDDSDAAVSPAGTERCDALDVDEDCDALVDDADPSVTETTRWYADADGDGYGDPDEAVDACAAPEGRVADGADCDDADPAFHPGASESCTDPVDLNCDGSVGYADADVDGWAACLDCDDADPAAWPGAEEIPGDGIDQDCDGLDAALPADSADTADSGASDTGTGDPGCLRGATADGGCAGGKLGLPGLLGMGLLARRRRRRA